MLFRSFRLALRTPDSPVSYKAVKVVNKLHNTNSKISPKNPNEIKASREILMLDK